MMKFKKTILIIAIYFTTISSIFSYQKNIQQKVALKCLAPKSLIQEGIRPAKPTSIFYRLIDFVNTKRLNATTKRRRILQRRIKYFTMIAVFTALSSCSHNYEVQPTNIINNSSPSEINQYQQNGFNFEIVNSSDISAISNIFVDLCQDAGLSQLQRKSIKKVIIVNQEDMTVEGGDFIPMYVNYDDPGVVYVNADVIERDLHKGRYNMLVHVWSHELIHLLQLFNQSLINKLYNDMSEQGAIPATDNPRSLTILTEKSEIIWAHDSSDGIYKGFPSPYAASGHPMRPVEETQKFEFFAEVAGLASRLFYFYNSIQNTSWQKASANERYLHYQRAYQYMQELKSESNNSLLIAFKVYSDNGLLSKNTYNSIYSLMSLIDTDKSPLTENEFNKLFPEQDYKVDIPIKLNLNESSS